MCVVPKQPRPIIAIVGSIDERRNHPDDAWHYDPPLLHPDIAVAVCAQLGAALATANWELMVYAGKGPYADNSYIEPLVVNGYLGTGPVRPGSIHVLYSRQHSRPEFDAVADPREAIDFKADLSDHWEPSFFRSLADVDAALILGGGHSAYLAGLVCLGRKIPLLAIGTFGAAGSRVLDALVQAQSPLDRADLALLGQAEWTPSSAAAVVKSLDRQVSALDAERQELQDARQSRRRSQNAAIALALFIAAALLVPTALVVHTPRAWWELALLFMAPVVAGASGGTIRSLLPRTHQIEISTLGSAALGAVAGGVSGLLYLTAQLTSSSATTLGALTEREYQVFVLFSVVTGFVAGLALDGVYQRLITAGAAEARDV